MEAYLLKSAACLALLLGFYKLALEREKMHVFKRFYLLVAVLISALIPFITITEYVDAAPVAGSQNVIFSQSSIASENSMNWFPFLLWTIYFIGVLFFSMVFLRNFSEILQKIKRNPKIQKKRAINVLLQEDLPPHTFWSYIFLNRKRYEKRQIPQEVYEHEKAHAVQKHSVDVLLMELLQIVFWFYPVIYLLKKAVKLNHEFLADSAVLKKGIDRAAYQRTLLSYSANDLPSSLVNPISYSSIKKRFKVMKTHTSKKAIYLRAFLIGPLLLGLIYGFSNTRTVERPVTPRMEVICPAIPMSLQEKATRAMVKEYNAWAKKVNAGDEMRLEKKTVARMRYIYSIMTPRQKRKSEKFPELPKEIIVTRKAERNPKNRSERERMIREERMAERHEKQIEREAERKEREIERAERREMEIERDTERRERDMERAERREMEIERDIERREREMERAERREMEIEMEIERREAEGDIPAPPPAPPASKIPGVGNVPSPPPPGPENANVPAPPPPPPSPVEAVKGWIEEGADFYLNGKKASGKEALDAVRENSKTLRLQVEKNDSGKTIRIFTDKNPEKPQSSSKGGKSNLKNTFVGPQTEKEMRQGNC